MAHLIERGGVWHYRRRVPLSLRSVLGRREIRISMRTSNRAEAIRLLPEYDAIYDRRFRQLRAMEMIDVPKNGLGLILQGVTHPDGRRETRAEITPDDIAALARAGLTPDQIVAMIERLTRPVPLFAAAATSPVAASPAPPPEPVPAALPVPAAATSPTPWTLATSIEKFRSYRISDHGPDWVHPATDDTKLRRLIEIVGADTLITAVDAAMGEHVLSQLRRMPANTARYRGLSVPQVIDAFEKRDEAKNPKSRMDTKTVNDHIDIYARLFKYAKRHHDNLRNPFEDLRVKKNEKTRAKDARNAFTKEELYSIFSSPIYTAFDPKNHNGYQYWAPLIGLFTGSRRAQIASLYLDDIYQMAGVWVLDFNENTEDKGAKTFRSLRQVPIHPELLKLGLVEYRDYLRTRGEQRLFPELETWTEKEGYGRPIGDWFSGYLRGRKRPDGKMIYQRLKKVFHSFRHTVETALRHAEVDPIAAVHITGREHKAQSTAEIFYIKDYEVPALYEKLCRISFENELREVKPFPVPGR